MYLRYQILSFLTPATHSRSHNKAHHTAHTTAPYSSHWCAKCNTQHTMHTLPMLSLVGAETLQNKWILLLQEVSLLPIIVHCLS